jgi:trypsin
MIHASCTTHIFTFSHSHRRDHAQHRSTMTNRTTVTGVRSLIFFLLWGSCVSQQQAQARTTTLATSQQATRTQAQARDLETRIIGGTVANQARFPYFTYLELTFANVGGVFYCGASLIAPDVVLTAGHCMRAFSDIQPIKVWVNRTSKNDSDNFGFRRKSVNIVVHPGYDDFNAANDIAVIKLDAPVAGVPTVQINRNASIPMPTQALTAIGLGLTISGGDISTLPNKLMRVSMNPVSFQVCKNYDGFGDAIVLDDQMLCAGGAKDTCNGDSGGPLLVQGTIPQRDVQVGITSFGSNYGCGLADAPGVYSRVSYHAKWIDKQLCQLSSSKPTACPSTQKPSTKPSTKPPTRKPTKLPTRKPSTKPPTRKPTMRPTRKPTKMPTRKP